jgi:hypothetical protein
VRVDVEEARDALDLAAVIVGSLGDARDLDLIAGASVPGRCG